MSKTAGPRLYICFVLAVISLLALVIYLCIPTAPRTAAELCGNYVLDNELVHEEMTLRPDETFTQKVSIKTTSEVFTSEGHWTYKIRSISGLVFGEVVFLDGCISVLERPDRLRKDYAKQTLGGGGYPAEYWFGEIVLPGADSWPDWKKVK